MKKLKEFIKSYQQPIVLTLGYLLVAALAFGLGRVTFHPTTIPEIKLEEAESIPDNYTATTDQIQSQAPISKPSPTQATTSSKNCTGKVKATTSSMIYHLPGQSGYDKLNAQACFDTEAAAIAAGYRKALR